MTHVEKFRQDHPEMSEYDIGYAVGSSCPSEFGYGEDKNSECSDCRECWNREITEGEPVFEYQGDPIAKVVDVKEENGGVTVTLEPIIKDSGDRTQFETGAQRDMHDGKGRMDLLPWAAIMEISKHCENGAKKYGEHNVDKGIPTSSLCDSAARHLAKYLDGWEDEPHLLAAAWNLLWAIQMKIKNPEVVNTPWRNENTTNTLQE